MLILTTSHTSEMKLAASRIVTATEEGQIIGECPQCNGAVRMTLIRDGRCDSCFSRYRVEFIAKLTAL